MDLFEEVPLGEQIALVKDEIALRERNYPRWVADKMYTADRAERRIRGMKSVLASLERLRGIVP